MRERGMPDLTRRAAVVAAALSVWLAASPAAGQAFDSGSTGADGALVLTGGVGPLGSPRQHHTATLLPDGKVLVTGGHNGSTPQSTAELFDPATGRFTSTGSMGSNRSIHTATPLQDGKVLIAGGSGSGGTRASAELYDPVAGGFTPTAAMASARHWHTATRLADGKVLIAGGHNGGSCLSTAEVYDPATGGFTATGSMNAARHVHAAALLADGKVLVSGGHNCGSYLSSAEVYDPMTGRFTPTGSMPLNIGYHTASLLPSGKVLVAGGWRGDLNTATPLAQLFDPDLAAFVPTAKMNTARNLHTATPLSSGRVLVAGGGGGANIWAGAELYDPATEQFTLVDSMAAPRYGHTATLLATGQVLMAAGHSGGAYLREADVYEPATSSFGLMFDPRAFTPPLDPDGDGVYHFTSITVPQGVTVRLSARHLDGPVHWLSSGPVTIDGVLDLDGRGGHGDTTSAQARVPSEPGAGGFPGGVGGHTAGSPPQAGGGPSGGGPQAGGGFSGNEFLVPLAGGSGGGGGRIGGPFEWGQGGGAGGGALLIASSVSIGVNGRITARGGPIPDSNSTCAGAGGGGAVRLVAPLISGAGRIDVGTFPARNCGGTGGASGRVRLEAMSQQFSGSVNGPLAKGSPLATFVREGPAPAVRVVRIAGVALPPTPSGSFTLPDVTIDEGAATIVEIEARGVPPGTQVKLHLFSLEANDAVVESDPLAGTLELSTTTASVVFPPGFTRGYPRAVWR